MPPPSDDPTPDPMKTPLTVSVLIHVAIIIVVIFGLPHFMKKPEDMDSIPVEMVSDISDKTTTNKQPVKAPVPKKIDKPKPQPKSQPKPVPPKEATPPDEQALKEPPKEAVEKDDMAPPKPKQDKKPEKKVPPKKITPPKPKEKQPDETQDFNKLLNDLTPPKPQSESQEDNKAKPVEQSEAPAPKAELAPSMSMSEMDALRQQLAGCWNINPGLKDAQDLAVEIKVTVNQDRTVSNAQIVDQGRYNSDTLYRTMADSALRAVRSPLCSPLRLPEGKYSTWNSMTIVFDPKEMF